MNNVQFNELSGRIDGVARVLMAVIADLEMQERLDGNRFCQRLRRYADGRSQYQEHLKCVQVIRQIADELDAARLNRSEGH